MAPTQTTDSATVAASPSLWGSPISIAPSARPGGSVANVLIPNRLPWVVTPKVVPNARRSLWNLTSIMGPILTMPNATVAKEILEWIVSIGIAIRVLLGDTATNVPWKANVEADWLIPSLYLQKSSFVYLIYSLMSESYLKLCKIWML